MSKTSFKFDAHSPLILIGDGWAADALAGFLSMEMKAPVTWIAGTGARLLSPLPTMNAGVGAQVLHQLLTRFEIEAGEPSLGHFAREFKNKSFRMPRWAEETDLDNKRSEQEAELWAPELRLIPTVEAAFESSLTLLQETLRTKVLAQFENSKAGHRRIVGDTVKGFKFDETSFQVTHVLLGSGLELETTQVLFADRWTSLLGLENLKESHRFVQKREPCGVLQVSFKHRFPLLESRENVDQGFFTLLHRDSGEQLERHGFGQFLNTPQSSPNKTTLESVWSVCLTREEGEDNHQITRKLRRLKQGLDRMFEPTEWFDPSALIPESPTAALEAGIPKLPASFSETVTEETLRFEDAIVFSSGVPVEAPLFVPQARQMAFFTDGYGVEATYAQVGSFVSQYLGIELPVSLVSEGSEASEVSETATGLAVGSVAQDKDVDLSANA